MPFICHHNPFWESRAAAFLRWCWPYPAVYEGPPIPWLCCHLPFRLWLRHHLLGLQYSILWLSSVGESCLPRNDMGSVSGTSHRHWIFQPSPKRKLAYHHHSPVAEQDLSEAQLSAREEGLASRNDPRILGACVLLLRFVFCAVFWDCNSEKVLGVSLLCRDGWRFAWACITPISQLPREEEGPQSIT